MNEMINNVADRMITKMKVINTYDKEWATDERRFTESRPCNKFDHELRGMVHALQAMDIDFEFHWNDDVTQYTAITIMGKRFDV